VRSWTKPTLLPWLQAGSMKAPRGPRPPYGSDYYGAYVRDPEGNKIHFVHRAPGA